VNGHYSPTHGDRVRIGTFAGPAGTVLHCGRGADKCWRVKLDDGRWMPLQRVVAVSDGTFDRECADCEIRFLAKAAVDPLCPNCESRQRVIDSRRARDASPSHAFGANRPRVHRPPVHPKQEQSS
jgi:hypothetical protein